MENEKYESLWEMGKELGVFAGITAKDSVFAATLAFLDTLNCIREDLDAKDAVVVICAAMTTFITVLGDISGIIPED